MIQMRVVAVIWSHLKACQDHLRGLHSESILTETWATR
jgi:hypothetical protein